MYQAAKKYFFSPNVLEAQKESDESLTSHGCLGVCLHCFPGGSHGTPVGRRQASRGSVTL